MFESWLCQVEVESVGKALYMHFLTPLMCKMRQLLCNAPQGVEKGSVGGMACWGPYVKRLEHFRSAI